MKLTQIYDRLWKEYSDQNPSSKEIMHLLTQQGENVVNDHIAFRTFNMDRIGIDMMATPFTLNGYVEKGQYTFEQKHLFAKHYEHKDNPLMPKVFISQLIKEDFSPFVQDIINQSVKQINKNRLDPELLIFAGNLWGTPSYEIYQKLRSESEYAAWVYVYGFRTNHFTVSVNALKKIKSIEELDEILMMNGFMMNTTGGEIKGTKEELLKQSSIMADIVEVEFMEGKYKIPACYYEFAERFPLPNGDLYNGFIAKSADKIFESTNFYTKK
jgi:hypothetical protein